MDIWCFVGCYDTRLQFYQLFALVLSLLADHENMHTFSAIRGFCWKKQWRWELFCCSLFSVTSCTVPMILCRSWPLIRNKVQGFWAGWGIRSKLSLLRSEGSETGLRSSPKCRSTWRPSVRRSALLIKLLKGSSESRKVGLFVSFTHFSVNSHL